MLFSFTVELLSACSERLAGTWAGLIQRTARQLNWVIQTQIVNQLVRQPIQRDDDSKIKEFEVTVSDDGERIEFTEVLVKPVSGPMKKTR